ncbi:hypothetical protein CDL15_Pgr014948 [Punica granatum]|uniref:Uncharacterized protein n=1 Tax=Punica granatum TaxID=22663 RepID=A0A218X075_PUNGR|nr:hypothetical protein CDL15_Pgr014948 [Punica granatum]
MRARALRGVLAQREKMLSVAQMDALGRAKLAGVSFFVKGRSTFGLLLALPWRKGEDRNWSTSEGGLDSPAVGGGWLGWTASGHGAPRHGEVKNVGDLPAEVSLTRLLYMDA